jgi:DNA polymerase-3 subunit alpha (Gram-positive type)
MEDTVHFLEMFPACRMEDESLQEILRNTVVRAGVIRQEQRRMELTLEIPVYINMINVIRIQDAVCNVYGLDSLRIEPIYAPELLATMDFSDLSRVMIMEYSPAYAILAGCKWELGEDGDLHLTLRANGKEQLDKAKASAERYIEEKFGLHKNIAITSSHEISEEELFQETARIRADALANYTPPTPSEGGKTVAPTATNPAGNVATDVIFGKSFKGDAVPISDLNLDMFRVCIEGEVFAINHRELSKRNAWVVNFDVTDYTGSVRISQFMENDKAKPIIEKLKKGMWVKIQGKMTHDRYENEMVMQPNNILLGKKKERQDNAKEKRVELHMHTRYSSLDALADPGDLVKQAIKWGHPAVAITDHGICQGFPDAWHAAGDKIKLIYGVEAYYVNDVDDRIVVHGDSDVPLTGEFVAFDIETTGLRAGQDRITEIGAVYYHDGEIGETFQTFVNPEMPIPQQITELTGIRDSDVADAPSQKEALQAFLDFVGDRPLVAHNADFDMGFITLGCQQEGLDFPNTSLDTLVMAQNLLPGLKKYKLDIVADHLSLPEFNHHRASDDAITVGYMMQKFFKTMADGGVERVDQINDYMQNLRRSSGVSGRKTYHMILLAQNKVGLKNLYNLVSLGHLKYYKRNPIVPKSELLKFREGLIIGSACEAGEVFRAMTDNKSWSELKRLASFYDYLEIQPISNNAFMVRNGTAQDEEELRDYNRRLVRLADELGKPCCATGDVHFLHPEHEIYRRILLASKKFADADAPNPLYFRTTDEMLEEFSYLGPETCHRVVIDDPLRITDMVEQFELLPKDLFTPKVENSVEDLKRLVYDKMHDLYGENPPEIVTSRVETELGDILGRHYDVIYMSAQKLVADSLAHGYLVGSRGSVGSSIVAFMSGITEVNSLPAHYRCPNCKHSDFAAGEGYGCGADMPDAVCPVCGTPYAKDGFDIPFETFLGFGGDKVPDIDLNFSGEYQANAHKYTEVLFGRDHVFRAGTIGTLAEKTAYGYVKKYLDERNMTVTKAEENRLAQGCVGVKRTTGQHPGGLVIIPQDMDVTDFCPVQHPADSTDTETITTHFEYHSMEANLLKLDMLGHDDPTMIRMLEDMTGRDAKQVKLDDPGTMGIFKSPEPLGLPNDDPIIGKTGTIGIPEFGTSFTRQMLVDTQPDKFDMLVRLSGFSHGTDVWLGNAKDLILGGIATVSETVGCRDDIMLYLISKGMEPKMAFKIMEAVRKGKVAKGGFQEGWVEKMKELGVPQWYIDSLAKIQYLFPKAHAVAYVMMAFRIAWFKVHEPLAFYSAYFYRRSQKDGFDAAMMTHGVDQVTKKIKEISSNPDATAKEQDLLTTLEACYEFYKRGFSFAPISLYESDATKFNIKGDQLLPPFVAVTGLGETAALDIVSARKGKHFISIEEFSTACPKVSKTHIDNLKLAGAFGDMPDTSQITLF